MSARRGAGHTDIGGLRPDIIITANNIRDGRKQVILVEIERKKDFSRTYREKVEKYKSFLSNNKLKTGKYHIIKPKILFVMSNLRYDPYLRPQHFKDDQLFNKFIKPELDYLEKQFISLMEMAKNDSNRFCFMMFPDFHRLNQPVIYLPSGIKITALQ